MGNDSFVRDFLRYGDYLYRREALLDLDETHCKSTMVRCRRILRSKKGARHLSHLFCSRAFVSKGARTSQQDGMKKSVNAKTLGYSVVLCRRILKPLKSLLSTSATSI